MCCWSAGFLGNLINAGLPSLSKKACDRMCNKPLARKVTQTPGDQVSVVVVVSRLAWILSGHLLRDGPEGRDQHRRGAWDVRCAHGYAQTLVTAPRSRPSRCGQPTRGVAANGVSTTFCLCSATAPPALSRRAIRVSLLQLISLPLRAAKSVFTNLMFSLAGSHGAVKEG
jgi:hypothetical protein